MPHKVSIVDKDGNSSEVTLPDFALDKTQQDLVKSMQALVKANPKAQKAYEELIAATNKVVKSTDKGVAEQKKAAEDAKKAAEKQVSALKEFRTNFSDRIGSDMRNTFTSAGNILTAAITTVTTGLVAGAGLLYKTFMDTGNAFRELAKSGLGTAGTGGEASRAVESLAQLGMSASEAASFLTGFGRASATLGKANFSKFVSGIANSGAFAAELGLTLSEAAEFAAEEIEMRQRAFAGQLQLNEFNRQSVMDAIEQTQRFAGVMGRSMKDINDSKKSFLDSNANINQLMLRLGKDQQAKLLASINSYTGAAAAIGGDFERLAQGLLNAAAKQIPLQDSNLQQIAALGPAGATLVQQYQNVSKGLQSGNLDAQGTIRDLVANLRNGGEKFNGQLSILANDGNEFAKMLINSAVLGEQGGKKLLEAFKKSSTDINDPMVQMAANMQNTLDRLSGAFKTVGLNVMSQFAGPLNGFINALNQGQYDTSKLNDQQKAQIKTEMDLFDEKNKHVRATIDAATGETKEKLKRDYEEKRRTRLKILYEEQGLKAQTTITSKLTEGLKKIADAFMSKFFPNVGKSGDSMGDFVNSIITWIDEASTKIKNFLDGLQGDTAWQKIQDAMKKIFNEAVPVVVDVLKNVTVGLITALWQNETVRNALILGIGGLFAAQVAVSALGSGVTALFASGAPLMFKALLGLTTAFELAALKISTASMIPSKLAGPLFATLRALPIVGAAGMMGKDAYDIASGEDEANKGANWGGIVGGVVGGLGAAAATYFTAGLGATTAPAIIAGGVMAGNYVGDWIGSFFDSPEGEKTQEVAQQQLSEQMQEELVKQQGLALAMATNPEHLAAVQKAVTDLIPVLNGMNNLKFDGFAESMLVLKDSLDKFFTGLQSVKLMLVDNVIKRLEKLYNVLKNLNNEGKELPETDKALKDVGKRIEKMPVDSIEKLALSFDAFAKALSSFISLTTTTNIERGLDWLLGKEDTSGSIIETVNKFADGVNADKLLKSAQAVQAFNSAVSGYNSLANPAPTAVTTPTRNTGAETAQPKTDPNHPMADTQKLMLAEFKKLNELMTSVQQDINAMKRKGS